MTIQFPYLIDEANFQKLKNDLNGKRVAIVAAAASDEQRGGAERFNEALLFAFREIGCIAEMVFVNAGEQTVEQIIDNYQRANQTDLSSYDFIVSSKVPTYAIPHNNHILYLNHGVRAFDDMFNSVFPDPLTIHYQNRALVHRLDFDALRKIPHRFSQGFEVQKRLRRWRGLNSAVIHPPLPPNSFGVRQGRGKKFEKAYFFIAGRLHPWKRIDLLISAVKNSQQPIYLLIAGIGEASENLHQLAGDDFRILFLGRISDEDLIDYYLDAIAVPFIPLREDYGYVTLEAFASGKPVITCNDSGEPARIVNHKSTGLITNPNPIDLCRALEWAYLHQDDMALMGKNAQVEVKKMSWRQVALCLVATTINRSKSSLVDQAPKTQILVMDMQPIDPPVGGGRQRLLGLYHGLGPNTVCRYVGSYDWPGEAYREHPLTGTLTEITVPLSAEHFQAAASLSKKIGGKTVIDLAFSRQAHLSQEYIQKLIDELPNADVLVFSHPWVYPLVKDRIEVDQVVIYDAQNVEGYLRAQLLNTDDPIQHKLLNDVCEDELELGTRANWILCCSHEDLQRFYRIYEFSPSKMRVVPNGVMAFEPVRLLDRKICRDSLGLANDEMIVIFIGSNYEPNIEGAIFILDELAPSMPEIHFVIAGGVGNQLSTSLSNVTITGSLAEVQKNYWLSAANCAINPMFSGSGTNIKMFDFMASSLPVVTTQIGARGIETSYREAMKVVDPTVSAFKAALSELLDSSSQNQAGIAARQCVEEGYSWERISLQLGEFIKIRSHISGQPLPKFSVVIPSYERHAELERLIQKLQCQIERDFEVIIVDQSAQPWAHANEEFGFLFHYHHSPVRGAVRARNTGAMLAQGEILAFIDDDCIPKDEWLLNARPYFADPKVLGIEGLISSDHFNDPLWRPVSNIGSEGIGFMTANLMVRSGVFQYLGGFDLRFDKPHFREDTDFGWRMLDLGLVPYANDVAVFHPAQSREKDRESFVARAYFFEKDALLYDKHPERYRILFEFEKHYERTPGFCEHLLRGFNLINKEPPRWLLKKMNHQSTDLI